MLIYVLMYVFAKLNHTLLFTVVLHYLLTGANVYVFYLYFQN